MAKELPYFKFEPSEWENGNIQMCTREEKGLFIDLCALYWSRLGDLPFKLAVQKLCAGNATAFDSLIHSHLIRIKDESIFIEFLEEQLQEFETLSTQNKKNAILGWEKRRQAKESSERNATASIPQSENDAIREEKKKEEKKRREEIKKEEMENKLILFDSWWCQYDYKHDSGKCKELWCKLSFEEINKILEVVSDYVKSTPDKTFRLKPLNYLKHQAWNNEIIFKTNNNGQSNSINQQVKVESFAESSARKTAQFMQSIVEESQNR